MALTLSKDSLNAEKAGQWFDRLQSLQITRRLGLMAMIAVAVAAGLSVFFWSQKPGMVPLYTGLTRRPPLKPPTCCAPRRFRSRSTRPPVASPCRKRTCTTPA